MRVVLVLGKKLLENGKCCAEFIEQLAVATKMLEEGRADNIVICGGVTRAGFPSEAEAGLTHIPFKFRWKTFLEPHSKTTSENIRFVRMLLELYEITLMVIISSIDHKDRTMYYLNRLWPEVYDKTTYEGLPSTSLKEHWLHKFLFLLARIDPDENIFVPLIKATLRRG